MVNEIFCLYYQFENKNGKRPEYLYIGAQSLDLLKAEMAPRFIPDDPKWKQGKFNGMEIMLVGAENHLNVG